MKRFALTWMLPPALVAVFALGPVLLGLESFFLRDVFSVHLEMRHALQAGLEGGLGGVPPVDPFRGGGQVLAANPNAVAFHPSALLHRFLPFWPAFNLHLVLHFLLAPFGLFWLGRELGLERRAAWVAGVTWGFSGFLVSQLAFYNLVGGVVAAPALAAAGVRMMRLRRRGAGIAGSVVATGLLWALVLVSGDPLTAVAAGVAAIGLAFGEALPAGRRAGNESAADVSRAGTPDRPRRWSGAGLLGAFAAGTLLALPQVVPFLAYLPASARSAGFGEAMRLAGSFDPRQTIEWLLPFAFGRPDQLGPGAFWGHRFYQGSWAFYFTLYPGLAALALVVAAGRSWRLRSGVGRVARRGWALVLGGTFFALGAFNPAVGALLALPGLDTARFPIKLWLWVAMGAALLCGVGWARMDGNADRSGGADADRGAPGPEVGGATGPAGVGSRAASRRRFVGALLTLALLLGLTAAATRFLAAAPDWMQAAMAPGAPREVAAAEVARWTGLAMVSSLAALALALLGLPGERSLLSRRTALAGTLLVTLHAAIQMLFLAPALVTEPVAPYRQPPLPMRAVPAEARVVHGSSGGLFGGSGVESGVLPVPEVRWVFRRAFAEAYPFFGALFGRRYDLNLSAEGLDTAELRLAVTAMQGAPGDAHRLRLLEAWGVDRLLLHRELEPAPVEPPSPLALSAPAARGQTTLLAELPSVGRRIRVYALPGAAPEVYLATGLLHLRPGAPPLAAAGALADPRFRPGRDVVLAEGGTSTLGTSPGAVEVIAQGPDHLEATTSSAEPGVLVWQRSRLPQHRATVDGQAVEPGTVNLYRVGVPVPAGEHRVRIEVDSTPRRLGRAGALAGLLLLGGLALPGGLARWRRRGNRGGGDPRDGERPGADAVPPEPPVHSPRGETAAPPEADRPPLD